MVRQHKTRSSLKKEQAAGATHPAEQKSESNAIVLEQSDKTRSGANVRIFATRRHSRRHKRKHPTDFCGVLLMMPCGCVELLTGFVRSEATE